VGGALDGTLLPEIGCGTSDWTFLLVNMTNYSMQIKYSGHTLTSKRSICDTNKKVPYSTYMGLLTLMTLIEVSAT